MITFFRNGSKPGPHSSIEKRKYMIATAYYHTKAKFRNVTGGSHPLTFKGTLQLISAMNVAPSEEIWEIGCGVPVLAASLSAASGSTVLCTDVENTQQQIESIMKNNMADRDISKSNDLLDMIYREKLDAVDLMIQQYKPFNKEELTLNKLCTELKLAIEGIMNAPSYTEVTSTKPLRQRASTVSYAANSGSDDDGKDEEEVEDEKDGDYSSSDTSDNESDEEEDTEEKKKKEDKDESKGSDVDQTNQIKEVIQDKENNINFSNVWSQKNPNAKLKNTQCILKK